eukprot:TRINITY_DN79984_c0_g1_i1.p1 TRINITY_DN79984_c0_g1~~TRINITY_DN79984_c0_g1_i1.p1  ORF type:complete len:575 (+),score=64.19 TRINITY_DN79984_c0_g1_i1:35-1759(+)
MLHVLKHPSLSLFVLLVLLPLDVLSWPGHELCHTKDAILGNWRLTAYAAAVSPSPLGIKTGTSEPRVLLTVAIHVEHSNITRAIKMQLKESSRHWQYGGTFGYDITKSDEKKERVKSTRSTCVSFHHPDMKVMSCSLRPSPRGPVSRTRARVNPTKPSAGTLLSCWFPWNDFHGDLPVQASVKIALLRTNLTIDLPLEMCRVQGGVGKPTHPESQAPTGITVCSPPRYQAWEMRHEHRYNFQDWLEYHHEIFGLDFMLHDSDGSLAEEITGYENFVRYAPRFHTQLSPAIEKLTAEGMHFCLAEFSITNCQFVQRARGRAVIELDIDEYLYQNSHLSLAEIVANKVNRLGGWGRTVQFQMFSKTFARSIFGRAGQAMTDTSALFWKRGSVIATSTKAFRYPEHHFRQTLIFNPSLCIAAHHHQCASLMPGLEQKYFNYDPYLRKHYNGTYESHLLTSTGAPGCNWMATMSEGAEFTERSAFVDYWTALDCQRMHVAKASGYLFLVFSPDTIRMHHYTEAFSWDLGRCEKMIHGIPFGEYYQDWIVNEEDHHNCGYDDTSLLWAQEWFSLRSIKS